jgi:hypothetical protein
MWEIMSYGKVPWMGHSNSEAMEAVLNGKRQDRPKDTPDALWELLERCWEGEADDRPTFHECFHVLKDLLKELQGGSKVESGSGSEDGHGGANEYAKTPSMTPNTSDYSKTASTPAEALKTPYSKTPSEAGLKNPYSKTPSEAGLKNPYSKTPSEAGLKGD